ncbi:MAG: hypothetical protein K8J31_01475, partial [Anaerolineae bacterium]|nr:hypothetical protein [Anaerolineae bacterium]
MFRYVMLACGLWITLAGIGVQAQEDGHPLEAAELIHVLDVSQTIDAATATLDWAYADTLGFVVHLTIADLPPDLQQSLFQTVTVSAKLRDTAGYEFSFQGGGFGPPDGAGKLAGTISYYPQAVRQDVNTGEWQVENDYFRNRYETLPNELALQFELSLVDPNSQYAPVPDATGQTPPTTDPASEPVGPFLFAFSIPLPAP